MTEHKPCPFCGGQGVIMPYLTPDPLDGYFYKIYCLDCGSFGSSWLLKTKEEAWEAWDRRV
jgi:Lar family restriction alleviation protein